MGPLKLVAGAGTKPATFANISNPEPDDLSECRVHNPKDSY